MEPLGFCSKVSLSAGCISGGVGPSSEAAFGTHRAKTIEDLEAEEALRRLQTLNSGDCIFFKKSALGNKVSSIESPLPTDFIEGRVVCFTFDSLRQYVVINIHPHGALQFFYGDLFRMAVNRDVYIHRLDMKRLDFSKNPRTLLPGTPAMTTTALGPSMASVKTCSSSFVSSNRSIATTMKQLASSKGAPCTDAGDCHVQKKLPEIDEAAMKKLLSTDAKTRPTPPGIEAYFKCRFLNKMDFVRKIRGLVRAHRQKFMELTSSMPELRLVLTQNVRAYELEMVGYLLDADPWEYAANPSDGPSPERVKEIIQMYKAAVSNPLYAELYAKWQATASNN